MKIKSQSWGMSVSKKLAVSASFALLLAGCSGSLWPTTEAPDPSGASAPTMQNSLAPAPTATPVASSLASAPVSQTSLASSNPQSATFVGNKVGEMGGDLGKLRGQVSGLQNRLDGIKADSQKGSDDYHALLGMITARLQRGSTPGNPILVDQWNKAQIQLERVAETIPVMTKLSNDTADAAAFGQYLLSAVQATYGLSGAVEEDHLKLQVLEDNVHQTLVSIDRLMTDLSQDMNRHNVYVNNERQNMTTLSLAIKNGELYGSSLATRAFTQTETLARAEAQSTVPQASDRPLVIIRFDRPNVQYQQALYNAVSQALSRKPTATFDLVAISPQRGTSAQMALNSAAAKRNGEAVLRSLTDMGVPGGRVQLLSNESPSATANEVHLYVH